MARYTFDGTLHIFMRKSLGQTPPQDWQQRKRGTPYEHQTQANENGELVRF